MGRIYNIHGEMRNAQKILLRECCRCFFGLNTNLIVYFHSWGAFRRTVRTFYDRVLLLAICRDLGSSTNIYHFPHQLSASAKQFKYIHRCCRNSSVCCLLAARLNAVFVRSSKHNRRGNSMTVNHLTPCRVHSHCRLSYVLQMWESGFRICFWLRYTFRLTITIFRPSIHKIKNVTLQCSYYKHFFFGATASQWARSSSFTRFQKHTQRHTTVGKTPLDEWLARRRDL